MKIFNSAFTLTFIWLVSAAALACARARFPVSPRLLWVLRRDDSTFNDIYHVCLCRWHLKHTVFHLARVRHVFCIKFMGTRASVFLLERRETSAWSIGSGMMDGPSLSLALLKDPSQTFAKGNPARNCLEFEVNAQCLNATISILKA